MATLVVYVVPPTLGFFIPASWEMTTVCVPASRAVMGCMVTARPTTVGSRVNSTPLIDTVLLEMVAGTVVPLGKVTVTVPASGTPSAVVKTMVYWAVDVTVLGVGVVVGLVAQALLHMSVVLAMVPTKGIPLPFISYGGSSLVPTLASVGILLNISQHANTNSRAACEDGDEEEWEAPRRARNRRAGRQRVPAVAQARYG